MTPAPPFDTQTGKATFSTISVEVPFDTTFTLSFQENETLSSNVSVSLMVLPVCGLNQVPSNNVVTTYGNCIFCNPYSYHLTLNDDKNCLVSLFIR